MKNLATIPHSITEEVSEAIEKGKPVLALESTIITHGMPYPDNGELAREVENVVRKEGVTPATIAVIDGVIQIGLDPLTLEKLAQSGKQSYKISRKDLGYALGKGLTGGTTVAATTFLSGLFGIKVFATGGIGGVHRGVSETLDISADLKAVSESPVIVVCAGAKSILDVPKTLEALETLNVMVIGYQTKTMPLFYLSKGGPKLDLKADSLEELISCLKLQRSLFSKEGIVVANPISKEHELDSELHHKALSQGLSDAKRLGVEGKELTPFLLQKMTELTKGKSLQSNKSLILNNAKLGSRIAKELLS